MTTNINRRPRRSSNSFASSVIKGKAGEEWFLANYHTPGLEKLAERSLVGDYRAPDGTLIEVKTEYYDLENTPNFFFERYSNLEKKTLGGPWRALEQGADRLVHVFLHDKVYFEFTNLTSLVETIEIVLATGTKKFKEHRILNPAHITTGYALPRHHFELLFTQHDGRDPSRDTQHDGRDQHHDNATTTQQDASAKT